MAVYLRGEDFGRLADFFGGLDDLEKGVVRVLHNLSFIDDPTRIFRAIRYENRYRFRMDGHTTALARAYIDMGLVGELSSARLRDELELLLDEETVGEAVLRLDEMGSLTRSILICLRIRRPSPCWNGSTTSGAGSPPTSRDGACGSRSSRVGCRPLSSTSGSGGCGCAGATAMKSRTPSSSRDGSCKPSSMSPSRPRHAV